MGQVENLFELPESQPVSVSTPAGLLALVDSLNESQLNEDQQDIIQALKLGIMSMALRRASGDDFLLI
jgi:hypothetical protein